MFRPKSFGETIKPSLLLHFVIGIGSPAYLTKHKVKKSVEIIYTLCVLAVFHLMLYYQHCCSKYFKMFDQSTTLTINLVNIFCYYSIILALIVAPRFNKEDVQNIIKVMEEIDKKMDTIGLPKQYRAQCKYQMYCFFGSLMNIAINLINQWYFLFTENVPIYHKILLSFIISMMTMPTQIVHVSFCFWTRYIRTKFSQLNYLMEETIDFSGPKRFLEISDSQIKRTLNVRPVKGSVQIITKAKECHLDLIKIAKRVNTFYRLELFSSLVTSILTIIEIFYAINFTVWYSVPGIDFCITIFPVVLWILVSSLKMIHLHVNCVQTSNEAGKAGYLLCRLYDSSTSMQFRIEVQRFTQQVLQNPLVLNVCSLVDIDDTFLTSTVGWVFTYIVVILQIQMQQLQQKLDANSTFVAPATN